MLGLGLIETTTTPPTTAAQPSSGGFWNTLDKILAVGQKGADVYTQVKGGGSSSSGPAYNPQLPAAPNIPGAPGSADPAQQSWMARNGKTVAIVGGGAVAIGAIVWIATRKKRGKK